jgi:ubiquinone/menaquinone biosynthesis C-methylase UbiE
MQGVGITNIEISQQSIEAIDYPGQHFDGIFCYGVMMMTDYRKALREFYRVLKPRGKVYLSNAGLGWYLYNLITPYNPAQDFDPRQMAIDALKNTLAFFAEGVRLPGKQLLIPSSSLKKEMEAIKFENIMIGGEGTLQLNPNITIQSFFPAQHYGLESVYEVLAWRKASSG